MPTAPELARQLRAALLRRERSVARRIVTLYGNAHRHILNSLNSLIDEMQRVVAQGETISPAWLMRQERYQQLLTTIEGEMRTYTDLLPSAVGPGTYDAVSVGLTEARHLVEATLAPLPAAVRGALLARWTGPDTNAILAAAGFLDRGSPIWTVLTEFGPALRQQVEQLVIDSLWLGYNPKRWARELRQVTGRGLDWSLRWARTLQMNAYREAARWSMMENQHIVRGWIWWSALDNRTCMSCIAMHGTEHAVNEVLDDHHNGRCIALPIVPSYEELVGVPIEEEPLVVEKGPDWFNGLDERTQREMMGPGKYEAWREGKFKLENMWRVRTDAVWGQMRGEASLRELIGGRAT